MTLTEILAELEARHIRIGVVDGKLRVDAPPGAMAPWLQAALAEHRTELLALLERGSDTGESPPTAPTPEENFPFTPHQGSKQPFGVILSDSTPTTSPHSENSEESCLIQYGDSSLEVRGPGSRPVDPLRVTSVTEEAHCTQTEVGAAGALHIPPGGTVRIPLDDLVFGDFLERNGLRIVGGSAYPDGRTYRPTLYLSTIR